MIRLTRWLPRLLLAASFLELTSAGMAVEPAAQAAHLRVLMIGNSYTNGTWSSFEGFVQADPQATITMGLAIRGGWTTEQHYNGRNTFAYDNGTRTLLDKLHADTWDVVVVQEQSQRPSSAWLGLGNERSGFRFGMLNLTRLIRLEAPQAAVHYFQTWPRDWVHSWLAQHYQGSPKLMHRATSAAYGRAARVTASEVVPIGSAWTYSMYLNRGLGLHASDGSHPGPTGKYLTGALFYAFLLDRSPLSSSYSAGLPAADERWLLQVADLAWQELSG